MPVLDTSFLIDASHDATLREVLQHPDFESEALLVPAQVALEFAFGTDDSAVALREISEAFVLRPFDVDVLRDAVALARDAARRGRRPRWPDVQIAATARYEGMCVLSTNVRDFREALGVPTWDYANEPAPPR